MAGRFVVGAALVLLLALMVPVQAAEAAPIGVVPAAPTPAAAAALLDWQGWDPDTGIYHLVFPVDGHNSYSDSWGACRDGCSRFHEGTDIFAAKMVPVVAAAPGTVGWMDDEQGGDCCAMALEHYDGWATWYIHLNNDTPGTDDGQGWGFAPGIETGVHVEAGDLIGWVGDSGNAESTSPHIHFELHQPDGTKINPYPHLRASQQHGGGTPGAVSVESYRVDDGPAHDGTGNDSKGNNDTVANCGETIELYLTIRNDGEGALTDVSASLSVPDPFVTLLYNTSSAYPDLAPGASAENARDWDLRISSDVPGGYQFLATFTFTADVGGPWLVDVPIPITCGSDITPPAVTSVTPHHGAYAVPVDTVVVAAFNEPVDPATVTAASFTLADGAPVAGAVTVAGDGKSATFDPDSNLAADTVYTVGLTAAITDTAGNPLSPVASSFSTGDITPGSIVDISFRVDDGPSHDGTGNDSVGNNDGAAQCGEFIELYVTVRNEGDLVVSGLSGAFSESDPYVTLEYNVNSPYPDLAPGASAENLGDWDLRIARDTPIGHSITAVITFSVLDPVELTLDPIDSVVEVDIPVECEAPTIVDTVPDDEATNVPVGSDVTLVFSKPIDPATVTAGTITVANGGPVAGALSVAGDGASATFDPDADLAHETEYTVTATSAISDEAGNPLVPFESTFITEEPDTTAPYVAAVVPSHNALDVPVDTDVTVTFSEPVDPATVTAGTFIMDNGGPVFGSVSVVGDGLSATFDPDSALIPSTVYSVGLAAEILDIAGNALVPFASTFTTQDPAPDPGVPVLKSVRVDDGPSHDGTGNDSKGNNDGFAQCGETIELYVEAMNAGDLGLTGLRGLLLESDPYVTLLYNTSSSYPSLAGGASAENPKDWDLRISANAPDGHDFDFTIRFSANEGGPWDVDATVPIACGGGDPDPGDAGPPVVVAVRIDDGPSHDGTGNDSKGNNDGFAQCGETIELYITIRNDGDATLTSLSGVLSEADGFVTLLYNTSASYPNLAGGASAENPRDWDLRISSDTPHGHVFEFMVTYTASGGASWPLDVAIPVGCGGPPAGDPGFPVFVSVRVDDGPSHDGTGNDSKGNNDGVAQCGETIELYVTVRNDGDLTLSNLSAAFFEADPLVSLLYNTSSAYPSLGAGAEAENPRDWDLRVSPDTPDGHDFEFTLTFTASGGGPWPIDVSIPISCP